MRGSVLIFVFLLVVLSSSSYAVQSITFNYEFNNNKSSIYSNVVKDDFLILNVYTDVNGLICKYDDSPFVSFDSMEGTFDYVFINLNKKSFSYLSEGIYKYYIKCKDSLNVVGKESEVIFSIVNPVKAEISLSKSSPLSSGIVEVSVKTSKYLSSKPSLSYSFDSNRYEPIALSGSNDLWKGYLIIDADDGEKIGSFKFRGVDLDGTTGEEITDGEIFLVDTEKPSTINDIDIEGEDEHIYIEWRFKEDFSHFNLYRSKYPNVEYSDFYKEVSEKKFKDNDVDEGRTYYYKINAVDEAGNEGDLSYEFSATVLNEDSLEFIENNEGGLDPELMGSVDSMLYDIESLFSSIIEAKSNLEDNNELEDEIEILGLKPEIESAEKELENLESEVRNYKSQDLARTELDKKIANAKSKLNVIKKKIPESISILSETEFEGTNNMDKMKEVLMLIGKDEPNAKYLSEESFEIMTEKRFSYSVYVRNVEVYYSDGKKLKKGIVTKTINSELKNGSLIEYIPKEMAQKASDLSFTNKDYNILLDDPIISFLENDKIEYSINGEFDLNKVKDSMTFFLINDEGFSSDGITGFISFIDVKNSSFFLPVFLIFLVLGIIIYFFTSNVQKKEIENLDLISEKLSQAKVLIELKDIEKLNQLYNEINEIYKKLSSKNKKEIYNKLFLFSMQIKEAKSKNDNK